MVVTDIFYKDKFDILRVLTNEVYIKDYHTSHLVLDQMDNIISSKICIDDVLVGFLLLKHTDPTHIEILNLHVLDDVKHKAQVALAILLNAKITLPKYYKRIKRELPIEIYMDCHYIRDKKIRNWLKLAGFTCLGRNKKTTMYRHYYRYPASVEVKES